MGLDNPSGRVALLKLINISIIQWIQILQYFQKPESRGFDTWSRWFRGTAPGCRPTPPTRPAPLAPGCWTEIVGLHVNQWKTLLITSQGSPPSSPHIRMKSWDISRWRGSGCLLFLKQEYSELFDARKCLIQVMCWSESCLFHPMDSTSFAIIDMAATAAKGRS